VTTRAPAPPPELRGYAYERLLGSGGFADVTVHPDLWEERSPFS